MYQKSESRGIHDNFQYMQSLFNAIEEIRRISVYKHHYPEEYANSIEHLYNLWIAKGFKDPYLMDEVRIYQERISMVENYEPDSPYEEAAHLSFIGKELPVKNADFLFKAIMKSIERADLLPREKRAIMI